MRSQGDSDGTVILIMHLEALNDKGKEIFPKLKQFKNFYLAGGTALALQIGHRISVDFDFFSDKDISKDLLVKVKKIFLDKKILVSVNSADELTVFVEDVKITFLKYPFSALGKFISYEGLNLLGVKELAATKAYTIGRRGSFKDYVDLYFIISEGYSSLKEIIKMAEKKYNDAFNARLFLEQLVYFKDIENTDIIFSIKNFNGDKMKIFFEEEVKNYAKNL